MTSHIYRVIAGCAFAGLCAAVLCVSGCSPWSTYPPMKGAMNIGAPTLEPIPEVMASAVWWGHENRPLPPEADNPVIFNLPPGASREVYNKVYKNLNYNGRPMAPSDRWAYHVDEVRVRANIAEVDMFVPNEAGEYEFITLYMRHGFQGYLVSDTRVWRIRRTAPPAHFTEPVFDEAQVDEQLVDVPVDSDNPEQ